MHHIAIMKKSWKLTEKILSGEKKIESRWYMNKAAPWDKIKKGDIVFFKDSGEPVRVRAEVDRVIQFYELNPDKVKEVLYKYGKKDGLGVDDLPYYYKLFKDKRYCMLIFLKDAKEVKPFDVDKKGYGMMAAWMCVEDVEKVKV